MRVETLNLNGGKLFQPLMDHVDNSAREIDLFCFQEVFDNNSGITESHGARADLFQELQHALPGFTGIYCPAESGMDYDGIVNFDLSYGIAMFVRNNLEVKRDGYTNVYRGTRKDGGKFGHMPRNLQYVLVSDSNGVETLITNLHGLWIPGYKGDSMPRLKQSRLAKAFLELEGSRQIVAGDFNLNPDTKSFGILAFMLRDLVTEKGIKTTRSVIYDKPQNPHADYILTSHDIFVRAFEVLNVVVSDHLPLRAECD